MQRWSSPEGPPKTRDPRTLRRVVHAFAPYRSRVVLVLIAVFFSSLLGILPPFLLKVIVDRGLSRPNLALVTRYTLYTLLAVGLQTGMSLWYSYSAVVIGQRIMQDFRTDLFRHLQRMSLRFFTTTKTGEIQSRLASDVGGLQGVVSETATNTVANLTAVISTLVAMFVLDWRLTLLGVGILPVFAVVGAKVGMLARDVQKQAQQKLAEMNAITQETLSVNGALLTKTSGRAALTQQRFDKENRALTESQVRRQMIGRYFFTLIGLTFSVTPALVYWLAGYLMGTGDKSLTVGGIVAFTSMQARFFFPLTSLMNVQVELTSSLALFDRIFEYLDLPVDIQEKPDAIALHPERVLGSVEFDAVTFRYDPTSPEPTLDAISFAARPGQLVALVGPSGAGKTSLAYLIPRLYDPDSGAVRIDGSNIRDVTLTSLADYVGMATQETYLVHDTVRENLRYGKPDATEEEMVAAARAAAIHDHIVSLPEGYDTVVGERGYSLSGGERQRLAIARALLKNPRILILDEATSALDTTNERLIQGALERLMRGRTTFAIAHRLSTIRAADVILVLEKGRIVEQGTHDQLLRQSGHYAQLVREQSFEPDPVAAGSE